MTNNKNNHMNQFRKSTEDLDSSEIKREEAESIRKIAEDARQKAEEARAIAEEAREKAEFIREEIYLKFKKLFEEL